MTTSSTMGASAFTCSVAGAVCAGAASDQADTARKATNAEKTRAIQVRFGSAKESLLVIHAPRKSWVTVSLRWMHRCFLATNPRALREVARVRRHHGIGGYTRHNSVKKNVMSQRYVVMNLIVIGMETSPSVQPSELHRGHAIVPGCPVRKTLLRFE